MAILEVGETTTMESHREKHNEEITAINALDTAVNENTSDIATLESGLTTEVANRESTDSDLANHIADVDAHDGGYASMSRQAIINGNFDYHQRYVGSAKAITDNTLVYELDHWFDYVNKDSGTLPTLTRSRQTLTSGDIPGSYYYTRLTSNGAGTSLGVNSYGGYFQRIEHGTRYLCGLNKKITLSFWARSNIANKRICPTIHQTYGSGGSPTSLEIFFGTPITLTSSWTLYTATFTTNTLAGKTFGTDNNDYIQINLFYMWGTTFGNTQVQEGVTAETFVGAGDVEFAQVWLNAGDKSLPFQPRDKSVEENECLRLYSKIGGDAVYQYFGSGHCYTTTAAQIYVKLPVKMRIVPTLETSGTAADYTIRNGATSSVCSVVPEILSGTSARDAVGITATTASGLTAGDGAILRGSNTTNAFLAFNAEL